MGFHYPADADGDGIRDLVDGRFVSGAFVDESSVYSENFTDQHLAGASYGYIVSRSGLTVTVTEEANPKGLRVAAIGGIGNARVRACGNPRAIRLSSGDEMVITCGSLSVRVLVGPIEIELSGDAMVSVPTGATVTVRELGDEQVEIENGSPEGTLPVLITVGSEVIELAPGDSYVVRLVPPIVPAVVDVDPDVLNPRSNGKWVTGYIELPNGYDPASIDVSTVMLNEAVPADLSRASVGDYDLDGVPDLAVKFARSAVIDSLPNGEAVEVCVTGQVGGETFAGKDTIRVLMPRLLHPNGGQALVAGQEYAVGWEVPSGYTPEYYRVFYTADDGASWAPVADNLTGTSYDWTVPVVASAECRVLVEAYDALGVMGYDVSDGTFAIVDGVTAAPKGFVPGSYALRLVGGNPCVAGASFEVDVPEAVRVRAAVYDVAGRCVRELLDAAWAAGSYALRWDGKSAVGSAAPAGLYLVRVEAGVHAMTGKVVLVR
jgi:hypothetical protein